MSDKYRVSEQDAAVWTLIHKLIRAAQGDPFEASRRVAELIAPILADAEKWRVLEKKYPNFCKRFDVTIDALEGEGEKG